MLSIGLSQGFRNLAFLCRRPSLLARCVVASFVLVPLAAMIVNYILPLTFPIKVGLALMAVCPGAPMIYRKLLVGRTIPKLAGSFQVTTALLAVVVVPIWLSALSALYPSDATIELAAVFRQVAMAQLIPIVLGLCIHEWFPELAAEFEQPIFKLGTFLLLGLILVILVVALPKVLTVGVIPVIAAVLFAAVCLVLGHILGGPEPESRLTIAVANSTRNAGLALAIATENFQDPGILGAIATYALLSAVSG
ncbi:MAG: hypothetical protein AAF974_03180, partial [Cyanobacteria bacterium P01_E01_bin.34]